MKTWIAALAIALAIPQALAQMSFKDDLGREVPVVGAVARLASLSPFLTEAIAAAGAMSQLVAVSEFSDFPPYARTLPPVSSSAGIAWEKLVAQRPDLVFAWKDTLKEGDVERFEAAGIKVFVFTGRRLADIPRVVRTVARLAGRSAPPIAAAFEERIEKLRGENAGKAPVTVFLEVSHRPLITIAGEHFINDALAVCNGKNVFFDLGRVAPEVKWEALMEKDPQAIVGGGAGTGEEAFRARWRERPTLKAVRENALVYVNGDHLFRPTPRLAEGVAAICRGLDAVRGR